MRQWILAVALCAPFYLFAQPQSCVPAGPRVALTFDDGPSGGRTSDILDILQQHGAQATFFLVGRQVPRQEHLVRRQVDEGHELGVHTWSHKDLAKSNAATREAEITRGFDAVSRAAPKAPIGWWRAPYGSRPELGQSVATSLGLRSRLWDVDTLDWKVSSARALQGRVMDRVRDGDVVLMHDHGRYTLAALEPMLLALKDRGFQMVSLSRLLASVCPDDRPIDTPIDTQPDAPVEIPEDLAVELF